MPPIPYPLRTEPHFRDYIWGGRKLETGLGKQLPPDGVWAESWEIIDHPEHQSLVTNGPLQGLTLRQISDQHRDWLLGDCQTTRLPLLLKYLDCQRVLSVQVHPDDGYAQQMSPPDLGKTEAWYVVAADPGAVLYAGLKKGVTRSDLQQAIEAGRCEECLQAIHPSAGDCVFIPAGTVHALGAGLLVAEIQQASNTTFRLYDWDRTGADGQPRPLHVEQAFEVIDFARGPRTLQQPRSTASDGREVMAECEKFVLERFQGPGSYLLDVEETFRILTAPQGGVQLQLPDGDSETLAQGESVLLPAALPDLEVVVEPEAYVLLMYVP